MVHITGFTMRAVLSCLGLPEEHVQAAFGLQHTLNARDEGTTDDNSWDRKNKRFQQR